MRLDARLAALAAALALTAAMEVRTDTPLAQVLDCMRRNTPAQLRVEHLRIEVEDGGGASRSLAGRFYSRRDERGLRAVLHLTAPAELAGMRYLLVEQAPEDALYLYLPALDKVRRVNGAGPEAAIAGTPLAYADLRLIGQALDASSITREGDVTVDGRAAHRLRLVPAIADSPFRRVIADVDARTCVILRAEFQDARSTVRRYRADPASLVRSGRFHYAASALVEDLPRGHRVRIALGGVDGDARLTSRLFDPRRFHRADGPARAPEGSP